MGPKRLTKKGKASPPETSIKKKIQSSLDWQRVIDEGTGFFGWLTRKTSVISPQDWEARLMTRNKLEPAIITERGETIRRSLLLTKVKEAGADADFLKACIFHLAERAVEHDRLPENSGPIGLRPGIELLKKIQLKEAKLRKEWEKAKTW